MITEFNHIIQMAIDESVPKCIILPTTKPLPNNILIMKQIRNVYRRNWKRYRDPYDHQQMTQLNKNITKEINQFRNQSWNYMLSTLDKSSSPFWKVSKILKKKTKSVPTLKHNNNVYYTSQEKSEILAQNFKLNHSISSNLSDTNTVTEVDDVANQLRLIDQTPLNTYFISKNSIKNIVQKLNNRKAPGLDGINNKCLKNLPIKGIKFITVIINACLKLCYFPISWKISKTSPSAGSASSSPGRTGGPWWV